MKHKTGFSRAPLAMDAARSAPCLGQLEVRCLAAEAEDGPAYWLVFDLTAFRRDTSDFIRQSVASSLHTSVDRVAVLCTHTHSVPDFFDPCDPSILAEQAVEATRAACSSLQPFRFRTAAANVGSRFSVRRRKFFPGLGAFTVWYGYRIENGRADGQRVLREQAQRMFGDRIGEIPELARPAWFDDPVDPLLQIMVFETPGGDALGSVMRFSAHPHTTSHTRHLQYHPDFPGFAREAVERAIGGNCIYMSGPCGDISPIEDMEFEYPPCAGDEPYYGPNSRMKAAREGDHIKTARRIGESLADIALAAVKTSASETPAVLRHITCPLRIPLRRDMTSDPDALQTLCASEQAEFDELKKRRPPLRELRAKADRLNQLRHEAWTAGSLTEDEMQKGEATLDMAALRFNDCAIAGLPSEPFSCAALDLRANTIGSRLLIATLANGWIGYLPPPADMDMGGYECGMTSMRRDGLLEYNTQAYATIEELMR